VTTSRLQMIRLVLILAGVGAVGIGATANAVIATYQHLPEIYAISNHGDILDFETIAQSSPQLYGGTGTARYLPPIIPSLVRVDSGANTVSPNIIIGSDDRVKIDNTTQFPWSTIVHIQGNFGSNTFNCTGWMLGISAVATAAHCLYDYGGTNLFATNVVVIPAQNTDATVPEPFGQCNGDYIWIINQWQINGDAAYDYGALTLKCRVGEQTGNLGFMMTTNAISGTLVNLTGYPYDKGGTTMWFGLGYVTNALAYQLLYDNDAEGSQSGAPVWPPNSIGCYLCVIAIHNGGNVALNTNAGVRITDSVFNFLAVLRRWQYGRAFLPLITNSQVTSSSVSPFQSPLAMPALVETPVILSPLPTPARPR
jgi:glutamyl endopeptidase